MEKFRYSEGVAGDRAGGGPGVKMLISDWLKELIGDGFEILAARG